MPLKSDLKTLYAMTLAPIRGANHAERLESFYAQQADSYDDFRKRLLPGRKQLIEQLHLPKDGLWIDMGGGTGSNLEYAHPRLESLQAIYIVDLSSSLLEIARKRADEKNWRNVNLIKQDVTQFDLPPQSVDLITFSYSLTMIPNWQNALEHAFKLLKPGGQIGVVDFYVSPAQKSEDAVTHPWWTRNFWPRWFAWDRVFLNPDHLKFLKSHFDTIHLSESRGKLPYVPIGRPPFYIYVGRRPQLS